MRYKVYTVVTQRNLVYILWITIQKHDQHMIYTLYKPKTRGYALLYDVLDEGLTTIRPVLALLFPHVRGL